jgi:hypothetical protein
VIYFIFGAGWTEPFGIAAANRHIAPALDNTWMIMERWWYDNCQGKVKQSAINLSQRQFVHHKSHMKCPGINPGLRCEKQPNCVAYF